jgi:hypothetical protein
MKNGGLRMENRGLSIFLTVVLSFFYTNVRTQEKHEFRQAIEDNSFLIEEAYNQEERVVQHIFNGLCQLAPTHDVLLSFTQEWPLLKYKHQLSYTIPYNFLTSPDESGLGDILLNYRYQLFYEDDWACVAPRLSLILPIGDPNKGLGNGVFGLQLNIAASKRLSDYWVFHLNAGSTFLPGVKKVDTTNVKHLRNLTSFNLGGSAIWLCTGNFNMMLEVLENFTNEFHEAGNTFYTHETIVNPGFRFAINIRKLQIVPGLSVPVSFKDKQTTFSAFLYLSFEHPY